MSLDDICLFLKWYLWLGAVGDLRSFYKDINSVYLFKSTALSDTFRQRMLKKKKDKGNVYLTNISTFHGKIIHKQFLLSEIIFKNFSIHLIFILFLDFQCCSTKALQYIIRTALNILYSQVLLATAQLFIIYNTLPFIFRLYVHCTYNQNVSLSSSHVSQLSLSIFRKRLLASFNPPFASYTTAGVSL